MIKFVDHKNINKKKWDDCVRQSSNACIFVYSWYLDVVCENWSALILNDYEAVFPLASKSKYKINYIVQPFFTRYFGLFSKIAPTTKLTNSFLNSIPEKFKFIEFCLQEKMNFDAPEYSRAERKFQLLNLNSSYETLYKRYSDNAKRSIKKAIKAELIVKNNIAPEVVVNLFKSSKGAELGVFKPNDYKILFALMSVFVKQNNAESLAVYDKKNNLCAAGFFMKNDNRIVFLKSGVTEYGKANGAMHFLFDNIIQQNSATDVMLDFGGSSVETVARFYKNFGAKDCVYLQLKKNSLAPLAKWISRKK